MTDNEIAFIKELTALSKKHNVYISGCGCCGSPSVDEGKSDPVCDEAGYVFEGQLQWASPGDFYWDYEGEMYKDKVIK